MKELDCFLGLFGVVVLLIDTIVFVRCWPHLLQVIDKKFTDQAHGWFLKVYSATDELLNQKGLYNLLISVNYLNGKYARLAAI